ncbi:hypothetical protein [Dyella sp.]|uniref:hypothetical protein n=1 Tax=Dyella sp. TaxID=1869338 RepID=UPI002FDB1F7C
MAAVPAFAHCCPGKMKFFINARHSTRIENFSWKFSAISSSFQRKLESSAFADFQVAGFQLSLE